jgi:hypothetical protein
VCNREAVIPPHEREIVDFLFEVTRSLGAHEAKNDASEVCTVDSDTCRFTGDLAKRTDGAKRHRKPDVNSPRF